MVKCSPSMDKCLLPHGRRSSYGNNHEASEIKRDASQTNRTHSLVYEAAEGDRLYSILLFETDARIDIFNQSIISLASPNVSLFQTFRQIHVPEHNHCYCEDWDIHASSKIMEHHPDKTSMQCSSFASYHTLNNLRKRHEQCKKRYPQYFLCCHQASLPPILRNERNEITKSTPKSWGA